jgi:hypothetical protein
MVLRHSNPKLLEVAVVQAVREIADGVSKFLDAVVGVDHGLPPVVGVMLRVYKVSLDCQP